MKKYHNIDVINNRNIGNSFDPHLNVSIKSKSQGPTKFEKNLAEKLFLRRVYTGSRSVKPCQISSYRANFLIVFSPDGTKLASTNGDHNVYIIDIATCKVLNTLKGHKRTPWTVAFHPSNNNVLASGCLNGEVRVWNLNDDSFESWQSPGHTVIASVAFHPKFNILAIATFKDIYFWDWNTSIIFGQTSTESDEEKIRYIKFDSTGDKLITAIALKNRMLSQYDSIAFREVFQFSCERRILKDIKMIMKFCDSLFQDMPEKHIVEKVSPLKKTTKPASRLRSESLLEETLPYLCKFHLDLVSGHLNVTCFCPTEFSTKVLDILKKNTLPFDYLVDKCYFCRYTWLYNSVFQLRIMNQQKNHICQGIRRFSEDDHVWSFSDCRYQELLEENANELNGVTEETLRYCFEQFAKTRIAPHFAEFMPEDGLCSKNSNSDFLDDEQNKEPGNPSTSKKPFTHEIPLRSDCFLKFCETFKLLPSGTFVPFLTSFAELYHYLPALQQISTKDDTSRLNLIMNEWEYLYCKLLLINNMIEGDNGLILKKRSVKTIDLNLESDDNINSSIFKENQELKKRLFREKQNHPADSKRINKENEESGNMKKIKSDKYDVNEGASTSSYFPENKQNCSSDGNENADTTNCTNCEKPEKQCNFCRKFDSSNYKLSNTALQLLRKDVDILSNEILRRNESKTQRHRMEKLYKQQLDTEISRIDGALFITIQIIKKCIRMHLSTLITELKKLLKINLTLVESKDPEFDNVYIRLFIFIIKRVVTFTRSILEFLCEYRYNINELIEIRTDSAKTVSTSHLSSSLRIRQHQNLNFRRNCNFDVDEPVFKEENIPHGSELSDDESNVEVSDNILSGISNDQFDGYVAQRCRPGPSNQSTDCSNIRLFKDSRNTFSKKVVASSSYIDKHLRFLECASDRRLRDDSSANSHEILVQNVNRLLFHQLQCQSVQIPEYYNSHPLHRLQVWDFSQLEVPDISNRNQNLVVSECKVHNDATISVSNDNSKVAVLLSSNQYDQPDWLGVFSLEWKTLGQILCSVALNQIAVSLSFSPTDQYLAVGFSFMYWEDLKMADIISVQQEINNWRNFNLLSRRSPIATSLIDITFVHRTEFIITVNCIRWSPIPGQGLIFGNSFGEIKFVV
ncbi:uncharacterized protein LOC135831999 isoform X2 [Planococcus citri]|uniref:uncharacterized protein LOC135831999 isoform X2 n=1 Tax=Planococcus citri TaxID=170843 RepID=UPI0031F7498E